MTILTVKPAAIEATLKLLKASGGRNAEGIVLWLGHDDGETAEVTHVFQPTHRASADYFHIPREGVVQLMNYLDQHSVRVLAQVHTHPEEAFHSAADDKWALVRHLDALSLVLPHFASTADKSNFIDVAAVFRLTASNKWVPVDSNQVSSYLRVAL